MVFPVQQAHECHFQTKIRCSFECCRSNRQGSLVVCDLQLFQPFLAQSNLIQSLGQGIVAEIFITGQGIARTKYRLDKVSCGQSISKKLYVNQVRIILSENGVDHMRPDCPPIVSQFLQEKWYFINFKVNKLDFLLKNKNIGMGNCLKPYMYLYDGFTIQKSSKLWLRNHIL